jgi:hypothetical protein
MRDMTMKPFVATLAATCLSAMLACGPGMAESRLNGLWSLDPEWCGNDPAETDHVPMSVSLPMLLTHDSECEVGSLEPLGIQPAAWRAELHCRAGGGARHESMAILALGRHYDGTVDQLVRIDYRDTRVLLYWRCP